MAVTNFLRPCGELRYALCAATLSQHCSYVSQGKRVTTSQVEERAEPHAKAALLEFLRSRELLNNRTAVTAELILDKQAVRADVVLCDKNDLHCFEIKTARDSLARMDRQLEVYCRHASFVTVVAATRHISSVLSRVAPHVGIYEMMSFASAEPIRVVREPKRSPSLDADAMLSLLPVRDLQARLGLSNRLRRKDAVAEAASLPEALKKQAVFSFFVERYGKNTRALIRVTRRRRIRPQDLEMLRRWRPDGFERDKGRETDVRLPAWFEHTDADVYRHVGQSFGPIPEELRLLLAG